ncbi:hypothetical protein X798_08099 [Onchocerca flexuosa]|uniref:Uncharacterized protein n=1 Tax=Onchocerca flexuosa TaxID=387005 RepID=A0A238BHE8_9BILA|nr:hypothetical protein X798_08099 [Onchocerca flexuosa]
MIVIASNFPSNFPFHHPTQLSRTVTRGCSEKRAVIHVVMASELFSAAVMRSELLPASTMTTGLLPAGVNDRKWKKTSSVSNILLSSKLFTSIERRNMSPVCHHPWTTTTTTGDVLLLLIWKIGAETNSGSISSSSAFGSGKVASASGLSSVGLTFSGVFAFGFVPSGSFSLRLGLASGFLDSVAGFLAFGCGKVASTSGSGLSSVGLTFSGIFAFGFVPSGSFSLRLVAADFGLFSGLLRFDSEIGEVVGPFSGFGFLLVGDETFCGSSSSTGRLILKLSHLQNRCLIPVPEEQKTQMKI